MIRRLSAILMAQVYDRALRRTEQLCLRAWRDELLMKARGETLEIGAGTGANLPHYPDHCRLLLSEPDRHMRRQLARKIHHLGTIQVELHSWPAEAISLPDASLDTIVSTLVLCSVEDLQHCVQELFRLLRPGGQLLFIEHVLAENQRLARWQRRLTPLWKCCCGNCHLDRDPVGVLSEAGFRIAEVIEASLLGAPAIVRRTFRGRAVKPLKTEPWLQNKDFDVSNLPPCPTCGGTDVARIVYGKPPLTRQIQEGLETGRIISGGCLVHNGAPAWHCYPCKKDFAHRQIDSSTAGESP